MSKNTRHSPKPAVTAKQESADITVDADSGRAMMQAVLSRPRKPKSIDSPENNHINGIVIGNLSDPGEQGETLVDYPGSPSNEPMVAISTEDLSSQPVGSELALGFVNGDPLQPIILGVIQNVDDTGNSERQKSTAHQKVDVHIDGDKLTFSADREIVLKCGKSSITLTRAGKIILKGAYLSNHATGVNRIKGGSVQIN